MNAFFSVLEKCTRKELSTLQVNMGNLCNQSCRHCHIDASPAGKDIMGRKVVDNILEFLARYKIETLDITGGAPELNPQFDYLVTSGRAKVTDIIVRSNLTVIFEHGKDYLPDFFKKNNVHLICSLPCYTKENVDRQRGKGVFEKSIKALEILNAVGFGVGNGLRLDLAHNPDGLNLSPQQDKLELEYRRNLDKDYKVVFNRLFTITNAPVNRFKNYLDKTKNYDRYAHNLERSFNEGILENLMCRSLLSVGFNGLLYDCDFNLALNLALKDANGRPLTIDAVNPYDLEGKDIIFGRHCFACTAGAGSSCQGALDIKKDYDVRDSVRYFYTDAAIKPKKELCCPVNYEKDDVSYIPEDVLEVSYGCGSPVSLSQIKEGEVVVDLGCGAGIDCFISAKKVGAIGKVIGIDMTEEMLDKANRSLKYIAKNLGFLNVEFRQGFLEDVPVESETADLVTSNCVINLSMDKSLVFAEIYRILKDGGRFVISDIVADREVPSYMKKNKRLWGECISGALTQDEFLAKAAKAGFYGLEILKDFKYKEAEGIKFCSVTVRGYKFKKGKDCVYIGQYATYLGPYSEVRDDDNHIFYRGVPTEVCTDTAQKLGKKPYIGQFIITEINKDGSPKPCCSDDGQENPCC